MWSPWLAVEKAGLCSDLCSIFLNGVEHETNKVHISYSKNFVMISTQAIQYLAYPLELVNQWIEASSAPYLYNSRFS